MLRRTLIPTLIVVAALMWALLFALTPELLPRALGGRGDEAGHAEAPLRVTVLPPAHERDALSAAIANRLEALELGFDDVVRSEPLTVSTPAGPWTVDVTEIYLPQELTPERVEGVLESIAPPGGATLSWTSSATDDLSVVIEARLDRLPTHIVEVVPWLSPASAELSLRPPQIAVILAGQGDAWYPNDRMLDLAVPLTVAIRPYAPYALEWAEQARASGKEVLVDWGDGRGATAQLRDRVAAVPFAKGLLIPSWAPGGEGDLAPLFSLLGTNGLSVISSGHEVVDAAQASGLVAARAFTPGGGRRDVRRELIRAQNLAVLHGSALVCLSPRPGELGIVMSWLIGLERAGFEAATASEALRRGRG